MGMGIDLGMQQFTVTVSQKDIATAGNLLGNAASACGAKLTFEVKIDKGFWGTKGIIACTLSGPQHRMGDAFENIKRLVKQNSWKLTQ